MSVRVVGPAEPLGPTGEFPDGHLGDDDRGELRMGVSERDGKVVLAFGVPVAWIACPPALARELAAALVKQADSIDGGGE